MLDQPLFVPHSAYETPRHSNSKIIVHSYNCATLKSCNLQLDVGNFFMAYRGGLPLHGLKRFSGSEMLLLSRLS